MRNEKKTQGFTLIELLIVIAIIGILAAVLIPNLLGARATANDTAADAVARNVLTGMAAISIQANTSTPDCEFSDDVVTVSDTGDATTANEQTVVNAGGSITGVSCDTDGSEYSVTVTYDGGSDYDNATDQTITRTAEM